MAIYKLDRGVDLGSTVKQFQLVGRAGLEPATSEFQVRRPNHSATLPPIEVILIMPRDYVKTKETTEILYKTLLSKRDSHGNFKFDDNLILVAKCCQ